MKLFKLFSLAATFILVVSCQTQPISDDDIHKLERHQQNPKVQCDRKPVVIAVIDTGFGWQGRGEGAHLCNFGHKDFTTDQEFTEVVQTEDKVPLDKHGHGTHIAGIIDSELRGSNIPYCIVVLKYYAGSDATGETNLKNSTAAVNYARQIGADYINYSGGGILSSAAETSAVKKYLDAGGKFIAAAGNEGVNIDYFHFYPAQSDDRIIVVSAVDKYGQKLITSSWGKRVNRWERGSNVLVYGMYMTGTSQATAVATGKIVLENENLCDTNKKIAKLAQ